MIPLETWRAQAQYFNVEEQKIAYWTDQSAGEEAPWLILIHGYPTSSWDWTGLWPRLAKRFRLAAADMLGFGLSAKPADYYYAIADQASLYESLASKLQISEAHIFAHDYGDTVAQELLARANEGAATFTIQSICFLNGGLFPEQHHARLVQKLGLSPFGPLMSVLLTKKQLRKSFDAIFGAETKASEEEIDAHWALIEENGGKRVMHKLLQYIPQRIEFRERWVGALQHASIPLRVIDGAVDPVSGRHMAEHYRKLVPSPDTVILDEIGHYPHTEAPQQVGDHFMAFHDRLSAA